MSVHPETLLLLLALGEGATVPELTHRLGLDSSLEAAVGACLLDMQRRGLVGDASSPEPTELGREILRVHGL